MLHLTTVGAVVVALVLFQTATLVIGGHIAKGFLGSFYEMVPQRWLRMLIVIVPLSGLGNLFAAYAFQSPIVAGVSFLILGLWAPICAAILIEGRTFAPTDILLMLAISLLGLWLGFRLVGTA
ncbi:MAG: hypothetical protein V2I43_25295 [Parvularcula sp.]|jgi:hypothetical protein|nr:hypothetical protein [Parvularcula sp.]